MPRGRRKRPLRKERLNTEKGTTTSLVAVYCTNGHEIRIYGNPMVAKPGQQVRYYGNPFVCGKCGAECYGGKN